MTELFPKVSWFRTGYDRDQVNEFFSVVRAAYEQPAVDPNGVSPLTIREAAFDLARRGYRTDSVDLALDRLEDAFAGRIRDQYITQYGQDAWQQDLAGRAEVLYDRLRRPLRERFDRPRALHKGYDAKQVDDLVDRITAFFDSGTPLSAADIRSAAFVRRGSRRAYSERQVDAFLARTVDILLGVS